MVDVVKRISSVAKPPLEIRPKDVGNYLLIRLFSGLENEPIYHGDR